MNESNLYGCKNCNKITVGMCVSCTPSFNTLTQKFKETIIPAHDPKELLHRIIVLEDRIRKIENYIGELKLKETFKPVFGDKK